MLRPSGVRIDQPSEPCSERVLRLRGVPGGAVPGRPGVGPTGSHAMPRLAHSSRRAAFASALAALCATLSCLSAGSHPLESRAESAWRLGSPRSEPPLSLRKESLRSLGSTPREVTASHRAVTPASVTPASGKATRDVLKIGIRFLKRQMKLLSHDAGMLENT